MWTLSQPHTDTSEDEISRALTYVNGDPVYAITKDQVKEILDLYDLYRELNGKPEARLVGSALHKDLLEAMHNAYDEVYSGRRLSSLRDRLKLGALKCPYCGFGEIKDLDHHIPRSVYKALSIFALNLVPVCHPCNNKKRAIAGVTPDAQFFHTYLDTVAPVTFLYAAVNVSVAGLVANFYLHKPGEVDDDTFARLNFQFARLEINDRLTPEVTTFMSSQRTSIETIADAGLPHLVKFLEKARDDSVTDFGRNHWQTALWAALACHEGFCGGDYVYAFGKKAPGA